MPPFGPTPIKDPDALPRWMKVAAIVCAVFWALYFASFASAATIIRNDTTDETMSSGSDWQDAMSLSGTATVVGAWIYCSAPDTLEDYLHADASMVSLRDNGLVNTRGTFKSSVDVSLSTGWNWVEFDTITTGDGDLSDVTEFFPSVNTDITANCLYGRSTSNQIQGQSGAAGAGKDLAFGIADGAGFDPGDPREDPVADVILPTATTYTGLSPVPLRFGTNVCTLEYTGETPKAIYQIERDDGGWTLLQTNLLSYAGFTVDPDDRCDPGLAYGFQSSLPLLFGDLRVRVKASFDAGVTYGDWSDWTEFTTSDGLGDIGGGTWGGGTAGSGDGSSEDWEGFFDDIPGHDDIYGSCKLLGFSFDFLGTGESEAGAGDGLPCIWTWIRYAVVPPAEASFNYINRPLSVLVTRWPLSYVTTSWTAIAAGVNGGGVCPFPTFLSASDDYDGNDLPTIDPCDWFETVPTLIDDNDFASAAFVTLIWCAFAAFCVSEALRFFRE